MKKTKKGTAEYARIMNEREFNKNPKDIRNSMNSSSLRDAAFEINSERMFKANRDLERSFKVGMSVHCGMSLLSVYMFIYSVSRVLSTLVISGANSILDDDVSPIHMSYDLSGWLILIPAAIAGIVMLVLSNKLLLKKCSTVLYFINTIYAAVGALGIIGLWDDMNMITGMIVSIAAATGLFMCNRTHEALAEIAFLVTQEGFPTFNSAMFYMHRSKYVKFREKWEKKNKKLDYYSVNEKPVEKIIVTKPCEPDRMDGVAVSPEDKEKWFETNSAADTVPPPEEEDEFMDGVSADGSTLPHNDRPAI